MTVHLRLAVAGDIPALHVLVESAYRGDSAKRGWTHEADLLGGQRTDQAALAEIIADAEQRVLLAQQDGRLIGCVKVSRTRQGVCLLGMLTVDPVLQAGGVGRQLIAAAEDLARTVFAAHTMEMTVIHQRAELIAYYARRGYAFTGRTEPFPYQDRRFGEPKSDNLDFVVMAKPL